MYQPPLESKEGFDLFIVLSLLYHKDHNFYKNFAKWILRIERERERERKREREGVTRMSIQRRK